MAGLTLTQFKTELAGRLADAGNAIWSSAQLGYGILSAVSDLSRIFPQELIYDATLDFEVSDESFTTDAGTLATEVSLANEFIKTKTDDLEIIVCDVLTEKYRVFSDESIGFFWTDKDQLAKAKEYFSRLEQDRGVPMYGYGALDFAVIIHRNIPDWTLPIFWKDATDWNILLPRKDSHV